MKKKENVIMLIGLLVLALIFYLGVTDRQKEAELLIQQQKTEDLTPSKDVCRVDGLECLYVGCNGFF